MKFSNVTHEYGETMKIHSQKEPEVHQQEEENH